MIDHDDTLDNVVRHISKHINFIKFSSYRQHGLDCIKSDAHLAEYFGSPRLNC